MRTLLLTIALLTFATPIEAQRYMVPGAYGYGMYRYWGPWGRPGGWYNPGEYRWNGYRPWIYRPRYY